MMPKDFSEWIKQYYDKETQDLLLSSDFYKRDVNHQLTDAARKRFAGKKTAMRLDILDFALEERVSFGEAFRAFSIQSW